MRKAFLLSLLIPAATIHADTTAQIRHFWSFDNQASPYDDLVGGVHGSVTEDSSVILTDGREQGTKAMNTLGSISGPRDFVRIDGDDPAFFKPGAGAFSVSLWFRMPTDSGANRGIFDLSGNGFDGPQMLLTGANSLNFRVDGAGAYNLVAMIPDAEVENDQWHFVAAVYDPALTAGTLKVYLNGSAMTASADRGATPAAEVIPAANSWLGTFNFTGSTETKGLNGDLDDVAIYEGTLAPEQIAGLYDGSLQPPQIAAPPALVLTSYTRDAATGTSTLVWNSAAGRSYTVWGSPDLQG